MYLNRQFFVRKEKLEQQGKSFGIAGGIADEVALILLAQLGERFAFERTVRDLAFVASKPGFANFLFESMVWIDWG
jgi:hypothetical protein